MGTWGTGPFDSDAAEDLLDHLATLTAAGRASAIESLLQPTAPPAGETLAAAAVVAAGLPAGRTLPWHEDHPGITSWLDRGEAKRLAALATNALDAAFPPDGWYWKSWVEEKDRDEARAVLATLRVILRTANEKTT